MSSTAAEMSPTRAPGRPRAMPAIIASARRVDELARLGRDLADEERPRAVAVPAVDDRADVDRHERAGADGPLAGDAVDDLGVDRDARARGERPRALAVAAAAEVALERRDRARAPDVALGQPVEVARGDPRLELGLDEREDLGDDPPGPAHLLDLARPTSA